MSRGPRASIKPIKFWHLAVGDEVKVIREPWAGMTGRIQQCIKSKNQIVVEGINCKSRVIPEELRSQTPGMDRYIYATPINYSDVHLIGNVPDPKDPSGPTKRIEVPEIEPGKTYFNKEKKRLMWKRWVPGLDVYIPWPRPVIQSKPQGLMDTAEADVVASTYVETLYQPPVPLGVEDELRNKYSQHRRMKRQTVVGAVKGLEREVAVKIPKKKRSEGDAWDMEAADIDKSEADGVTTKHVFAEKPSTMNPTKKWLVSQAKLQRSQQAANSSRDPKPATKSKSTTPGALNKRFSPETIAILADAMKNKSPPQGPSP